ncbi:MAG: hypothetical protein J5685_08025 [Clostridiales bacterium]|nr:hypothetical protein [Clostridiales bacterium]
MHYRNFKTVVYIPAAIASSMTEEKLCSDYGFLERYVGLDKVYLETHRGDIDVPEEQLLMIKRTLEDNGVAVSGGITTIIPDLEGSEPGKQRLFNTFCYTDSVMRAKAREISEAAARLFDEVILDDFYFTNCTCERCIREKGSRDWVSFRRDLMRDVSKELIVRPAKAVNPNVRMVVKYPNWRESYHFTGYLPKDQQDIFDATYIGTETRSPRYADQHLPEYLSYSLVRYIDNAWPGRNGGGWFDTYQCWSADRYLEQAYLTAFAKARELMFFQWSDLIDNYFLGGMGIQLKKIDDMLDDTGDPTGIPVYIPYGSSGENHLEMRLGMTGIPVDPTPGFPSERKTILLTESSASDPLVIDKLESFVRSGGDAFITSGFLLRTSEKLHEAGMTEAYVSGRKINVTRYQLTGDTAGYVDNMKPVIFPEILHGNNASWSLINGGDGDYHTPLFLRSTYGRGRLYILSVPDNPSDIYSIPQPVTDLIKRTLDPSLYVSGKDLSMFTYDDGSFFLYRYVKNNIRPDRVKIYTDKEVKGLQDQVTGELIDTGIENIRENWQDKKVYAAVVTMVPGVFRKFKWIR